MKAIRKTSKYCLLILFCFSCYSCGDFHIRDRISGALSKKYEIDNYYVDDSLKEGMIKRVIFVPSKNLSGYEADGFQESIDEAFLRQLRRSKKFDVIPYGQVLNEEQKAFIDSMDIDRSGSYDADKLFDIGRDVNAQGILFTAVSQYDPKKPLAFGCRINLIHIRRGIIVWAVDEVFDAKRDDIKNLARAYYYDVYNTAQNPSLRWEVLVTSMNEFVEFYFYEVIKTFSPDSPVPQQ